MNNKILVLLNFLFALTHSSAVQLNKPVHVTIENKTAFNYTNKVVEIPWQQVKKAYPAIDTGNLKITEAVSGQEAAYQLEHKGTKEIQNLLVQLNIKSRGSVKLLLQAGNHRTFITKTYGRFVPERKGDFAWENDKIAFRMYGKELERTPAENAYGMDVWVKRTGRMVLNERYKRDDYHVDHGDGLDYYNVGLTLGAGNMAPFVNDSVWYSKNFTGYKLLDNGPLRTTFQLMYDAWDVAGKPVSCIKTISLEAGEQLNKITVDYRYEGNDGLQVVAGIVKRTEPGVAFLDEQHGIAGYWEPASTSNGTTGVAVIMPSGAKKIMVTKEQILTFAEMKKDVPLVYYAGAVWDKAGKVKESRQWFDYLTTVQQSLSRPGIDFVW